jgi:hypothetical protein
MSKFTTFLPPELADIGLMAFPDPSFAEGLVDAPLRLPPERVVDPRTRRPANDSTRSEALELPALL